MARYQLLDASNRVINIIEWDGVADLGLVDLTIAPDDGTPIFVPVPEAVSPLQARIALRELGLMPSVKAFIVNAPEEVAEAWEYATIIERGNAFIALATGALGMTVEQVDDLFRLAATK